MSCRYLENVLSRQGNSKTILRCLEDVLCRLGMFSLWHHLNQECIKIYLFSVFKFDKRLEKLRLIKKLIFLPSKNTFKRGII